MKTRLLTIFILLIASLFLLTCSKRAAQCPLCDREVHQGMQVNITHKKVPMQTCCMACAITFRAQTADVEIKSATDYVTDSTIDAKTAFYVVGSDVSPCIQDPKVQKYIREPHAALHSCYDRCEPGILAFRSKEEAHEFQQEYGGLIRNFQELPALIAAKGRHHHD